MYPGIKAQQKSYIVINSIAQNAIKCTIERLFFENGIKYPEYIKIVLKGF